METLGDLLAFGGRRLARPGIGQPRREAALLLASVLGTSEASVLAHGERTVAAAAATRFRALVERRAAGEPAAYLLGEREFYGRPFAVDSRVLVPRPETEHLVETVLALDLPSRACVADVGTGSGILAVTLALERPGWRLLAVDASLAALAVARTNAQRLGVRERVGCVAGDLVRAVDPARLDAVVANLPYVDPALRGTLQPEVERFEPESALFAPERGLALVRRLLSEAAGCRPGTPLACEIGEEQLDAVLEAASSTGCWELVEARRDWAGHDRVVLWKRSGETPRV